VAAVQFADPSVTIQFDTNSKAAALQRRKAYANAAKQGYWVAAAHLAFPGIGHLRAIFFKVLRCAPRHYIPRIRPISARY
jgi:hypothetical protein